MSQQEIAEVCVEKESVENIPENIPVDGVPEPDHLPEPINECAEKESTDVSENVPVEGERLDESVNDTVQSTISVDNSEEDSVESTISENMCAEKDTVEETATEESPVSVTVSDTNETVFRNVDTETSKKFFLSVMLETLMVWLIIFDYSVIFPTKVFINRTKDTITDYTLNKWNEFAERCAKFEILMENHPEFGFLMLVLTLETLVLARNISRTFRCLRDMFNNSVVRA